MESEFEMVRNHWVFCFLSALLLSCPSSEAAEARITQVAPGIYVGSAPRSAADYRCLKQLGIRTVIDCRLLRPLGSRREQRYARRCGMAYRKIPIDFHPADDHAPHDVVAQLVDPEQRPVYVHCQLGRDRTSLVVALYRVHHLGWPPAEAYAAMQRRQFNPLLLALDRYFWQHVSEAESTHPR